MSCECDMCVYGREVQSQLSELTESQREFFEDMYDRLMGESMDRNYYQAIVNGTWPSSEEILASYRSG